VPPFVLLALLAAPVAEQPAESYFTATPGLFRSHTAGVLRPDQGTVEIVTTIDRPLSQFGNDWEFLLKLIPTAKIGTGANTLFGIFLPPEPERGLAILLRNGKEYIRADITDFQYPVGRPITLAVTWSDALRAYIDGKLLASAPMRAGLDEALLPYDFSLEQFAPYRTDALRISTRARRPEELLAAATQPLTRDEDTALLVTDSLSQLQRGVTAWHRESGYHLLLPAWRREKQVIGAGEPVAFPLAGINHGRSAQSYEVQVTIFDLDGQAVDQAAATVVLPADARHHVFEVALPLTKPGWYRLSTTLTNGARSETFSSAISVVPPLDPRGEGALAGYYGQHQDWDADTAPFAKIGVRSTRGWAGGKVFLWNRIEPVEGQFEWARAEAYVEQCRAAGMDVLGLLGYPSRWAAKESPAAVQAQHDLAKRPERWQPADLAAWGNYVRQTVTRFRGRVAFWEIYNEVNFSPPGPPATFSGTPEDYLALLQVAYREAKRADPGCQVLISGFSADVNHAMPLKLIELGALEHCDLFNAHGYSGSVAVADWAKQVRERRPAMPLWQTEQMWHQLEPGPQRRFLTVASFLDFLAAGYARFYNMGSTEVFFDRYTGSPTPDFQTIATFQDQVRRCDEYVVRETFAEADAFDLRHRLRRADGRTLTILGSELGAHRLTLVGQGVTAMDEVGRAVAVQADGQRLALPVERLVYLLSDGPLTDLQATLTGALPLCRNGGFEEVEGDVGMGGLRAGRPRQWQWRDTTYDPGGRVMLDLGAASGKYALAVTSTGAGRVYAFQYTKTFAAGQYTLTAQLKRTAGDSTVRPYAFSYDIEANQIQNQRFEGVTDVYGRVTWTVTLAKTGKLAIGLGIDGGAGTMLIDDVSFEPTPAP